MYMIEAKIPKELKNLKCFTYQEALTYGLTKRKLERFVQHGEVQKISRGIYAITAAPADENPSFGIACKIVGFPCAICLWSALVYYDLTDEIDRKTWVMAPSNRRRTYINIRMVRVKNPQWNIGILREESYWITTLERTIIDCLVYHRFVGTMAATVALKRAIQAKMTNISNLIDMASRLGCLKKVYPRLEVFIE